MTLIQNLATHDDEYVTVSELAVYWKVSERSIHYWVAQGALPSKKFGRLVRIRTVDALAYGRRPEPVFVPVVGGDL